MWSDIVESEVAKLHGICIGKWGEYAAMDESEVSRSWISGVHLLR